MIKLNSHFNNLKKTYIFSIIEQKLADLKQSQPTASIINLGIGDVALPLAPSITLAIQEATKEMATVEGIRGYGPSEGYDFLRNAIVAHHYANLDITPDEVFISDGINTDCVNFQELFSLDCSVAIPDPTYPAYLDSNIMAGRHQIVRLPCLEENDFCPLPPSFHVDIIYLCTPSNPTGVAMNRAQLTAWVEYAKKEGSILLVDNAYEAFITSPAVPKSIFEIEGAHEVAVEFRSFSKSAGFTGLRCAYTVLPKAILKGELHALWRRRQACKTNGVAYPIQKGALAVFSTEGIKETQEQIAHYMTQARRLRDGLEHYNFSCYGGLDTPYIWWKTPTGLSSWDFFDLLLSKCHLLSIPGVGFGSAGEGYVRLSAFTTSDKVSSMLSQLESLCAQL
jgi:LL-diaminopimelate aminotransferase